MVRKSFFTQNSLSGCSFSCKQITKGAYSMRFVIPVWLLAVMAVILLVLGMLIWRSIHHREMCVGARALRSRNHVLDYYCNMHRRRNY